MKLPQKLFNRRYFISSIRFVSAVIYSDTETNEWGRTLVWDTKEDWLAYAGSEICSKHRERGRELSYDGKIKYYEAVGYATAD